MRNFGLNFSLKDELTSDLDIKFVLDIITQKSNIYFFYGKLDKDLFYLSDNMCKKFGFEHNYVFGFCQKWEECIYSNQDRILFNEALETMYKNQESNIDLRFRIIDAQRNVSWIHFYGGVQYNEDKTVPLKFVGYMSQQDDYLLVDPVTGFPMESYLEEYLDELHACEQEVIGIGVHFKHLAELNYNKGREFTNELLKTICGQLNRILKDKLKFFRLDGPIILALLDAEQINRMDDIIYMIRTIIKNAYLASEVNVSNPTHVIALKNNMNTSMFIENIYSLFKMTRQTGEKLYVDANLGVQTVMTDNQFKTMSKHILKIHEDVMHGMNHFRIVIQPVVDVQTEKIVGGETLLRWQYDGKDVSPSIFIEILEKQNLIQQVGRWVFEQAVQMAKMITAVKPDFYISVNVSLLQLKDEGFVAYMKEILDKYKLPAANLVVEMTESAMDGNQERVKEFVEECVKLGILLALDDFGTGYSSIANLFEYQTKIIKVDRSLLLEMEASAEKCKFITSMIKTFKMTGRKVIVEGVETEGQRQILEDTQCDYIQGYYYYRPLEKKHIRRIFFH